MIAQKREAGAQTGSESVVDFGRIDADDGKFAVVDFQFFLKFDVVAQLHLAFSSPVAPVKRHDERKLSGNLGKRHGLALVIRQFKIREPLSDGLVHGAPPWKELSLLFQPFK
jgi:hypothetical protein